MKKIERRAHIVVMASVVLTLAGCSGEKHFSVKGKLEENKVAVKKLDGLPPGTPAIRVCFYPVSENEIGEPQYAVIDDDGNFDVPGPRGKGIPAGKYRISVESPKPGTHAAGPATRPDGGGAAGPPGIGPGTLGRPPGAGPSTGGGGTKGGDVFGLQDRFNGAFSREKSPLTIEITDDTQLLIDVGGKGKVTIVN